MLAVGAWGQTTISLTGSVIDAVDGHQLGDAGVTIINSSFSARTDQFGRFAFISLPEGRWRLRVTADGYETLVSDEIEVVADIARTLEIALKRKIYILADHRTVSRYEAPVASPVWLIDRAAIRQSQVSDLADLLNRIEGVSVRPSGSGGGRQVSIRGCDPRQVLVLINGQRMNMAGNGEADLGAIPFQAIERVEVYRGGESARFGPDALGGVVSIITQIKRSESAPELATRKYWGAWKGDRRELTATDLLPWGGVNTKFGYFYQGSNGDFDYRYTVSPRPDLANEYRGTRRNAGRVSHNYFMSTGCPLTGAISLIATAQAYASREGLPGAVSSPDTTSWKEDRRRSVTVAVGRERSAGYAWDLSAGFSRLEQYFNNLDDPSLPERYENRFINDIATMRASLRRLLWVGNELMTGGEVRRDILYHDDFYRPQAAMGRTVRDDIGLSVADQQALDLHRVLPAGVAVFDYALRWDGITTSHEAVSTGSQKTAGWSHKVGASISRGGPIRVVVRGSYGTSYRLPEINALFWKGDVRAGGNPQLRPERAEHSDAGIDLTHSGRLNLTVGTTYFHSFVRDLIVWQPGYQEVWKPVNLASARLTGREDVIRVGLFDDHLRLSYQNTITTAKNRTPGSSTFNKSLTYRPHYITQVEAAGSLWRFRATYRIRWVDIRYSKEANTKWYDAYRLDDLDLAFTAVWSRVSIEATGRIRNVNDADYVLIGHYPMPGREWGIDVAATYRIK